MLSERDIELAHPEAFDLVWGNLPEVSRRSEEHTSELQSHVNLVCRRPLEEKKRTRRRLRSFAASWLLNALLRVFAMSIVTPQGEVLLMSVQDCWRPPL